MKHARFRDRDSAGDELAQTLLDHAHRQNAIVLALPRGGVRVASRIAQRLHLPLDVLVVRKLGVPCLPELAMGAIATGDVCVLNDEIVDLLGIEPDAIGAVRVHEKIELDRREHAYRGSLPPWDIHGKTVILVDDGVATGATMRAAIAAVRQLGASRVVAAAPVMARDTAAGLRRVADEVAAVALPSSLRSVGEWFEQFPAVADEEVQRVLESAAARTRVT